MKKIGKTEQAVYDFIKDYIEKNSYPPSIREIASALSLRSTSSVHLHLRSLSERGLLKTEHGKQRSITLAAPVKRSHAPSVCQIPLIGKVAAGNPILAYDDIQGYYDLPLSILHGGDASDVFMLNVEGNSMIDAGILDGDMILVLKGVTYSNGDIVVALVGSDTATVKRIYRGLEKVRLQPENSNMKPIFVEYNDVEVIGKVIGVIRTYY